MKRSRLRFRSNDRARLMRSVKQARELFLAEFSCCWFCGVTHELCVHEMACGSHRKKALSERFTWAVACGDCNCHRLTDYALWPLERQLAMKVINDPLWMNEELLVDFNRLRGRDPQAISWGQVVPHICRRLDGR